MKLQWQLLETDELDDVEKNNNWKELVYCLYKRSVLRFKQDYKTNWQEEWKLFPNDFSISEMKRLNKVLEHLTSVSMEAYEEMADNLIRD